jgi:hypothetical protein
MKRDKNASLFDRLFCWGLRTWVLFALTLVAFGLYTGASRGDWNLLNQSLEVLCVSSFISFLARSFADMDGTYSRVGLLNAVVYLHSLIWLPAVAVVALYLLTQGDFTDAGGAVLFGGFCWLLGAAGRSARAKRERAAEV